MATLVFDIETVGEEWESFDETTKEVLSRWVLRSGRGADERETLIRALKDELGISPLTGSVVSIAALSYESGDRRVFVRDGQSEVSTDEKTNDTADEKRILQSFWDLARSYDVFVTFNGRAFDVPFLLMRSLAHSVMPSCDLMRGRYLYQQRETRHIDLLEQFTFYGAVPRRQSLHLYCRAFGIESPKAHGVSGDDVARLFREGEYDDIAEYNMHDVLATAALYKKWLTFLAPESFMNDIFI